MGELGFQYNLVLCVRIGMFTLDFDDAVRHLLLPFTQLLLRLVCADRTSEQ